MAIAQTNTLSIVSTDASTNTAVVRYIVKLTTTGETWWGYDVKCQYTIDGESGENASYTRLPQNSTTTVLDITKTISNASGKTVNASFSYYTGTSAGTVTGSTSVYIDLPRYATANQNLSSKGLNSITMNWSSDSTIDYIWYSTNNGSTWNAVGSVNASSGSYTISSLTPNTTYNIKTRVRRKDSQLTTDSSNLAVTTYNKGTISSVSNFNHGDNASIVIANPSGASLNLTMSVGGTQIFSKSVSAGTNAISFTDAELDNIYKKYGNSNSVTATFVLTTAGSYTDTKTCTITLTGNQKTIRIGNNGVKRGKLFIGINGAVKKAVIWVGDSNNVPRRGI